MDDTDEDPRFAKVFPARVNPKRLILRKNASPNGTNDKTSNESFDDSLLTGEPDKGEVNVLQKDGEQVLNKENQERLSLGDRRSSTSWLKTNIPRGGEICKDLEKPKSPFRHSCIPEESFDNTVAELRPHIGKTTMLDESHNPDISLGMDDNVDVTERHSNAANVKLTKVDYYTDPPLEKIDQYVKGETCIVPNFTIGHKSYGKVFFPESFDIYGLDLDEIGNDLKI